MSLRRPSTAVTFFRLLLPILVFALVSSTKAGAESLNTPAANAVGGIGNYFDNQAVYQQVLNQVGGGTAGGLATQFVSGNAFGNVVGILDSNGQFCSGSLINSRTILTAAHCLFDKKGNYDFNSGTVTFLSSPPTAPNADPTARPYTGAVFNSGYRPGTSSSGDDIALLSLSVPASAVKPVTLGTQLPANQQPNPASLVGQQLVSVGFGGIGTGDNCCAGSDGKRRVVTSTIGAYLAENSPDTPSVVRGTSPQFFYMAQFLNPTNYPAPAAELGGNVNNYFNVAQSNTAGYYTFEGATVGGDSGGPLFVLINNQLVQIGELCCGASPVGKASQYGDVNFWTPLPLFADWLAQNSPLRQVASNSGNFNWSNAAAWSDVTGGTPIAGNVPNNTNGFIPPNEAGTAQLAVGKYYDVTLANPGAITLDINPTIDSLTISGASSQLSIPQNALLTTVVGSQMSAGALLVNGGLTTQALSLTGGVLAGTGTVTASGGVSNAATVAPGTAAGLGKLTIAGNYTQTAAGTLSIRLGANNVSDQLAVGGAASLAGALVLTSAAGDFALGSQYTVLAANTLTGSFATPSPLSAFLAASPSYSGNAVQLSVVQTQSLASGAKTNNEVSVANALTQVENTATGTLRSGVTDVLNSQNTAQEDKGLDEFGADGNGRGDVVGNYLTGNMAAARIVGNALDEHLAMMRADDPSLGMIASAGMHTLSYSFGSKAGGQLAAGFATDTTATQSAAAPVGPTPANPFKFWAQGVGGWQNLRSDGQVPGMTQSIGGVIAGADAVIGAMPGLKAGAAFSFTSGNFSGGGESGTTDAYRFTVYGTQSIGAAFIEGRVGYGHDDMATNRFIDFAGLNLSPAASTSGDEVSTRFGAGYGFDAGWIHLEPSAAIAYDHVTRDGFSEDGAGTLGLNVGSGSLDSLRLSIGARAAAVYDLGNGFTLRPTAQARFEEHVLNEQPNSTMSFIGAPAVPFLIQGVKPGQQSGLFDAGFTIGNGNGIAMFAAYSAEVRSHETTQAVVGGVRATW